MQCSQKSQTSQLQRIRRAPARCQTTASFASGGRTGELRNLEPLTLVHLD